MALDIALIFIAGIFAGAFGTLVGAGSMLTMPLMILLGYPAVETIAANRFGVLGITTSGYYEFNRKGLVDRKVGTIIAVFSTIGAVIGAFAVIELNEGIVERTIGVAMVGILLVIFFNKNIGLKKKAGFFKKNHTLGILSSLIVGFYLGFIGLAAGMLLMYLAIFAFGQTFLQSAGTVKMPAFIASLISFFVFLYNGKVIWSVSIALFISMFIGSYFGSKYADRIGNEWIRRLFVLAAGLMALKLIF
jgi:uncharacterized protein